MTIVDGPGKRVFLSDDEKLSLNKAEFIQAKNCVDFA